MSLLGGPLDGSVQPRIQTLFVDYTGPTNDQPTYGNYAFMTKRKSSLPVTSATKMTDDQSDDEGSESEEKQVSNSQFC